MFDIGPMEFVVILVVALFVIGPERIPEVARTLGRFIGQLRQLGGDIGDPIQQVREALHEGIQEGEALAHQIQADVEAAQEDIRTAASLEDDPAAAAQPAMVQPAAATGVAAPAPDSAAAALRDTAREAAAVLSASSAATAPRDDDLTEAATPIDDAATGDEELDPVQQAIAAIEANDDYAPIEPALAEEETSDGAADDDTYDPVLDTLARRTGNHPQDTDDAAMSVGPREEPDPQAGATKSRDDDAPTAAASGQEEPAAADAGAATAPDTGGEATETSADPKTAPALHADGLAAATVTDTDVSDTEVPLYTEVALPATPTETGDEPGRLPPADGVADSGATTSAPGALPAELPQAAAPSSGLIAAGELDGGGDSSAVAVAQEDAVRVALEPSLYEALQGMDISPEERARELIVLGLFREGRMTAERAAWHRGLSEQEFDDLLAYKGISQT